MEAAEIHWKVTAQQQSFGAQPATHKSLQNAALFRDAEGSLRMKGHLQYGGSAESVKHTIVIPADHPFTLLLVIQTHVRLLHAGV